MPNLFIRIGVLALYFISGGLLYNFLVHITYSFYFEKLPERYKNSYMHSHFGNAVAAILSLLVGLLIPIFLRHNLGLNFKTLAMLLGFTFGTFMIAIRLDKIGKK